MYVQSYNLCNAGESIFTKQTLTRGGKIFFAFLFIEYIFPLFINLIYDTQPIFRLPISSLDIVLKILLLILVSIFGILLARYTPTIIIRNSGPIKPLPKWFIVIFSLFTISIGYSLFSSGLTQWRYTTSISSNSVLIYAALSQVMMPTLGFWVLMTDHQFILSSTKSHILVKVIMLMGIIFSTNGLGSIINTLMFTAVLFAPHKVLGLLFNNSVKVKKKKKFIRNIGLLVLSPIILSAIFYAGSFAKVGSANTSISFRENIVNHTIGFNYLVNRHSVHLSQLAASLEDGPNISDLSIPFNTAMYRINILTGIDPDAQKPEIATFARLALLQFANFEKINPRGGSSPGFLASMTMVFPISISIISVVLATFIVVKLIDFIMYRQPSFSWIGAIVFAYIPLRFLTDSPLDLIVPGPVIILLLFTLLLSFRREKINQ